MIDLELEMMNRALKEVWPMLTIFIVVIASIRVMYIHNSSEKFVFYKEFLNLLFIIYALLLYELLTNTELNTASGVNIVPFTEIMRYQVGSRQFYYNVIGNIIIFIPFGYFVSNYIKANKISHILFVSVFTSLTVEFVQHYIGRSFDIDDIILNVLGAMTGFLIYIAFNAIEKHLPKFFRSDLFYNLLCIILLLVALFYYLKIMGINII